MASDRQSSSWDDIWWLSSKWIEELRTEISASILSSTPSVTILILPPILILVSFGDSA